MKNKIATATIGTILATSVISGMFYGNAKIKEAEAIAKYEKLKSKVFTEYIINKMVPERKDALILVEILGIEARKEKINLKNINKENVVMEMIKQSVKRVK